MNESISLNENDGRFMIDEALTTNCDASNTRLEGDNKENNPGKKLSIFKLKPSMPKIRIKSINIIHRKNDNQWEKFDDESKSSEDKQELHENIDLELVSVHSIDSSIVSSLSIDDSFAPSASPKLPSKWFSKAIVDLKKSPHPKEINRSISESKLPPKPLVVNRSKTDSAAVLISQNFSSSTPPVIIRVPSFSEFKEAEEEELSITPDIVKGRIRRKRTIVGDSGIITTPIVGAILPVTETFDENPTRTEAEELSTQSSFFHQKRNKFVKEIKYICSRIALLNCFRRPKEHELERATGCLT